MGIIIKLFCVAFFIVMAVRGQPCPLNTLAVAQKATGKQVNGKPQWEVTVTNSCTCTQLEVKLYCTNFQSAEEVSSSVLAMSGDECLLNGGQPIHRDYSFSFTYARDTSYPFRAVSAQIACS